MTEGFLKDINHAGVLDGPSIIALSLHGVHACQDFWKSQWQNIAQHACETLSASHSACSVIVQQTQLMCSTVVESHFKTYLQPRADKSEGIGDKLRYTGGHHASAQNGYWGRSALIALQQLFLQYLKCRNVHTCIRQDADLRAHQTQRAHDGSSLRLHSVAGTLQ